MVNYLIGKKINIDSIHEVVEGKWGQSKIMEGK
jgi:hypothetical protein